MYLQLIVQNVLQITYIGEQAFAMLVFWGKFLDWNYKFFQYFLVTYCY